MKSVQTKRICLMTTTVSVCGLAVPAAAAALMRVRARFSPLVREDCVKIVTPEIAVGIRQTTLDIRQTYGSKTVRRRPAANSYGLSSSQNYLAGLRKMVERVTYVSV